MTAVIPEQEARQAPVPGGIGDSVARREDLRLLEGESAYLGDLRFADLAEAVFVRSEHPHARIRAISTEAARNHPGVLAVMTGSELAEWVAPLLITPRIEGLQPTSMPALAIQARRPATSLSPFMIGRDGFPPAKASARLGPSSTTSRGAPSLTGNLRVLRNPAGLTPACDALDTLLGAVIATTPTPS